MKKNNDKKGNDNTDVTGGNGMENVNIKGLIKRLKEENTKRYNRAVQNLLKDDGFDVAKKDLDWIDASSKLLLPTQHDNQIKWTMITAAAIDRLVHHSVIIELNLESYRMEQALKSQKSKEEKEVK